MEYYSAIKNEILTFATTWMDLQGIMWSEISQTEKDKYHMISLICKIQKIKKANKTKWKQTHRCREQMDGCQRGGGGWIGKEDWEVQTSSYKINKPQGCNMQHKEYGW